MVPVSYGQRCARHKQVRPRHATIVVPVPVMCLQPAGRHVVDVVPMAEDVPVLELVIVLLRRLESAQVRVGVRGVHVMRMELNGLL